jgi:L-2-hydroxyglutarate oxidase LhgO
MDKAGTAVIGAGVVGLAVARELAMSGAGDVVLLEKNPRFGAETSSRNSEVIHGGMYYPPGSLKAKLCVRGNRLLYELCAAHAIKHKKIGKLIVALDERELRSLEKLKATGDANGSVGQRMLSRAEMKQLEPGVEGIGALHSPETGIVDSEGLMRYLHAAALEAGAISVFDSEVAVIARSAGGYRIRVTRDNYEFEAEKVVNCAGLFSDKVAAMAGLDTAKLGYTIHFCKGEYFKLNRSAGCRHLIYPVPDAVSLGVHLVIDMAGNEKLGPNAEYIREIDYQVDTAHAEEMYSEAARYLPVVKREWLSPDTCGIRPKLQGPKDGFRDFIIREESDHGLPGFINLLGIESPGLTSAVAIAEVVRGIVQG